ncbi:hypothetical protein MPER_06050, partial [Moniliophthora perniciosa FA553]
MISQMMGNPNGPPKYHYRKPKFIKLLPGDSGEGLPDVFFEDPYAFQPKPDLRGEANGMDRHGFIGCRWNITRMMQQGRYYLSELKNTPEEQFIKVLIERKRQNLLDVNLGDLPKQDVILRVYICDIHDTQGHHRIWRRIRVSAGLKIGVFQDKILCPVMGWARNMHSYIFTDYRDGSLYGPKDANFVDCVAYKNHVGCKWLPDDEYVLAHLFASEGQKIGYLYDFGDKWYHEIVVEKILPVETSDGQVEVITGSGMCPGENMKGPHNYRDFLKDYDQGDEVKKCEHFLLRNEK